MGQRMEPNSNLNCSAVVDLHPRGRMRSWFHGPSTVAFTGLTICTLCAEARAIQYTLNNVTATYTAAQTNNRTRTVTLNFSGSFDFTASTISNVAISATGGNPSLLNFNAGTTSNNLLTFTGGSDEVVFTLSGPLVEAPNVTLALSTPGSIREVCTRFAGRSNRCFRNNFGTADFDTVSGTISTPVPATPPAAISLVALMPLLRLRKRYRFESA